MPTALIYPHQLFPDHPATRGAERCVLVEDPLFFTQYRFHAQKLILHRASMRRYADELRRAGHRVDYVEAWELTTSADIGPWLAARDIAAVKLVDPCDDWLESRVRQGLNASGVACRRLDDPHFLTPWHVFDEWSRNRKTWFFTEFYIQQRKRLRLLVDERERPVGGQWSFDPENRRKLPRDIRVPAIAPPPRDEFVREAEQYVRSRFPDALGLADQFAYPISRDEALAGLHEFVDRRLAQFGDYEDAMHRDEAFLFHSVLTPALNIGLLAPREVVDTVVARADSVPLNSLEGFVRQVIGWREYTRGVYRQFGRRQRSRNFWRHERPIPAAFYSGTTGIEPVDVVIRRVLRHAYCHHIERLMILGNFLLLCEVAADAVYQWFMELFIDAYDWVMVPNVYGMSQYADGGLITTKPYISGSSYVLRMSNFRRGAWCDVWDALYWRFIHVHRDFFAANPRMAIMAKQCERLGAKLDRHLDTAERFLTDLWRREARAWG